MNSARLLELFEVCDQLHDWITDRDGLSSEPCVTILAEPASGSAVINVGAEVVWSSEENDPGTVAEMLIECKAAWLDYVQGLEPFRPDYDQVPARPELE